MLWSLQLKYYKREYVGKMHKSIKASVIKIYKTDLPAPLDDVGPFSPVGQAQPKYRSVCTEHDVGPPLRSRVDVMASADFFCLLEDCQVQNCVGVPLASWSAWFMAHFLFYVERLLKIGTGMGNYEDIAPLGMCCCIPSSSAHCLLQ